MTIGMEAPNAEYKVKFTYQERAGSPIITTERNVTKEQFEQLTGGTN